MNIQDIDLQKGLDYFEKEKQSDLQRRREARKRVAEETRDIIYPVR